MQSFTENFVERTLETLTSDLISFNNSGGDIKDAKEHNNVINERLFNVELSQVHIPSNKNKENINNLLKIVVLNVSYCITKFQVSMPALHISLGTYLKLFNMLEKECYLLDVKLAGMEALKQNTMTMEEYEKAVSSFKMIESLERDIIIYEEKVDLINDAIALNIFKDPNNDKNIRTIYKPRLEHFNKVLNQKVNFKTCFLIFI